jgi:purine-nucleoside phosphorylase
MMKKIEEAVSFIKSQIGAEPQVGIVLGSGLGSFTKELKIEKEIPYGDIPHFPVSTVKGHSGKLIYGELSGKKVLAMAGRFHYYEGYSPQDVVFPVRVMKFLGVKTLLLSNAAGATNRTFKVGDLMIINDHISFLTPNPFPGHDRTI